MLQICFVTWLRAQAIKHLLQSRKIVQALHPFDCFGHPSAYSCTPNCSFDRCPQAQEKTKKKGKKEHSLHQKSFIWQSLASRTGNLGQGIEDGVMRGDQDSGLKVTLRKWPKAMQCYHWICDDVSVWKLWWQLGRWADSGRKCGCFGNWNG